MFSKPTKPKKVLGLLVLVSFLLLAIPIDIQVTKWDGVSYEIPAFETEDGLLKENQYAISESEGYYIRGENGLPQHIEEFPEGKELVNKKSDNLFAHLFKRGEEKFFVISDNEEEYRRMGQKGGDGPTYTEIAGLFKYLITTNGLEAAVDVFDYNETQSETAASSATISQSVGVGHVLVVAVSVHDTESDEPESVTYNGDSLTSAVSITNATDDDLYAGIWYLSNPDPGTHNLVVDLAPGANTATDHHVSAYTFSGADTTNPIEDSDSAQGLADTTLTLTHSTGGAMLIDILTTDGNGNGTFTEGEHQSLVEAFDYGSDTVFASQIKLNYSHSYNTTGVANTPKDVAFNYNGTKMYIVNDGAGSANALYQYTLSTPWDVSSASYDSVTFSVESQTTSPQGVKFKYDGSAFWLVGNNTVFQYNLTTPWNLATASYASVSTTTAAQETSARDVDFKNDGTKMYVIGALTDAVLQYSLSTPWDVSTSLYDGVSVSIGGNPQTMQFNIRGVNGTRFFAESGNAVREYVMTTPWDLSTAFNRREITPTFSYTIGGLYYNDDIDKLFALGSGTLIQEYNQRTASTSNTFFWDNSLNVEYYAHAAVAIKPAAVQTETTSSGLNLKNSFIKFLGGRFLFR